MRFKDRAHAGGLLGGKLKKYTDEGVVVYAIPRGGVVTAAEIAKVIHAPLDLIIVRKIGHPYNPEYAIAAVGEFEHILAAQNELALVDKKWLKEEMKRKRLEIMERKKKYLRGRKMVSPEGKIAIVVDDGIATGLTLRAGIRELKHYRPAKIVVAVPVVPSSVAIVLKKETDELITLEIPADDKFLGAVGEYYDDFNQVSDEEVMKIANE